MITDPPRCRKCRRPLRDAVSLARGFGPRCWRLVRPPEPRRPHRARKQVPGQTEINLNERPTTMAETAAQRVAEFLPEFLDVPDDTIATQRGAALFAADVRTVLEERVEAVDHLHRIVDHQDDDCTFDPHGTCQAHFVDGSEPGKCGVAEARTFLAQLPASDIPGGDGDREA